METSLIVQNSALAKVVAQHFPNDVEFICGRLVHKYTQNLPSVITRDNKTVAFSRKLVKNLIEDLAENA